MMKHIRCKRTIRKIKVVEMMLIVLILQGCNFITTSPPASLLNKAISGVAEKDQYRYQGKAEIWNKKLLVKQFRYKGEIRKHKEVHTHTYAYNINTIHAMSFSPKQQIVALLQLQSTQVTKLPKSAIVHPPMLTEQVKPLQIKEKQRKHLLPLQVHLTAQQAKNIYSLQLQTYYEQLAATRNHLPQLTPKLEANKRSKLQQTYNEIIEKGYKELQATLKAITVTGKYVVWVHQHRSLPAYIEGWMTIIYPNERQSKQETLHTILQFIYE